MKDRIKQVMESQGMTQQVFANYLGLSPASLSSIFNGRTNPTLNIVEAIKKKFPDISTDWLMFGTGGMHGDGGGDAANPQQTTMGGGEQVIDFGEVPVASSPLPAAGGPVYGRQQPQVNDVKIINKPQRSITEIRIFYDDQTWETFVPKK